MMTQREMMERYAEAEVLWRRWISLQTNENTLFSTKIPKITTLKPHQTSPIWNWVCSLVGCKANQKLVNAIDVIKSAKLIVDANEEYYDMLACVCRKKSKAKEARRISQEAAIVSASASQDIIDADTDIVELAKEIADREAVLAESLHKKAVALEKDACVTLPLEKELQSSNELLAAIMEERFDIFIEDYPLFPPDIRKLVSGIRDEHSAVSSQFQEYMSYTGGGVSTKKRDEFYSAGLTQINTVLSISKRRLENELKQIMTL